MESLEGIEDQGRNTERGQSQSAHPLFISDSSRRQITSKASPCYQIAKGPWDVPGWKTGHQDPPGKLHTGLWLSVQGTTQLLPLGEEVATSPPLGNTLDRGCRVIESRAVATGLLHFHYPTTLGEGTKASLTHCPVAQGSSFILSKLPRIPHSGHEAGFSHLSWIHTTCSGPKGGLLLVPLSR